ncbi:AAA family ATPase [Vibrio cholerae]|uniref:AAA family ATPase n=1 Tax=Vibrio cholerae TaxID=666 RepID=UPI0011D40488|nr:AAA family ATPase [Vibrio cholerae]EGR4441820.1 chromosome segregation protein SMC [Vibrio cholerae]EIN5952184.1 AAA family ATPase [Vibrio cholerae]EIV0335302.1 AAA family ATPase [Vibrio cholerae]MCX9579759.1 AAA family ATPase [Vibrio cholerae]MDX5007630.1 AAA family ATPase [Vibrio cholerae]
MRLASFTIGSDREGERQRFKNLKNVTIDFEEQEWITLVIGWNGTGKSNVLEALATVFLELIGKPQKKGTHSKPENPSFAYEIEYLCYGKKIRIQADPDNSSSKYIISYRSIDQQGDIQSELFTNKESYLKISLAEFTKQRDNFLPKYVFGYYSGHSERMHDVFLPYLEKYDENLRNGINPGLRKLFYAKPVHSQFALLAFMLKRDDFITYFLENHFGIDTEVGIDSVLFVLNQPPWKSNAPDGDPRFWMSRGVVKDFLSNLYDIAIAPIRIKRKTQKSLWNSTELEHLYLYVKDLESLERLVGDKPPSEFFQDLESTYVSELISEVRIRVKLKKNDGSVTFRELSEGEQQLLTVLGLLRFTAEEESLFLLDEPDTHLNPKWSVDYIDYLNKFVTSGSKGENNSHIVLTTHNPIAIAELTRDQVQILSRDDKTRTIESHKPNFDPRGMGYAGIITSDMFGLATSVDSYTEALLERKRQITAKDETLSITEKADLQAINVELENLGFRFSNRDRVFEEYLRARYEFDSRAESKQKIDQLPSDEKRAASKKLIQQVLAKLKQESGEEDEKN